MLPRIPTPRFTAADHARLAALLPQASASRGAGLLARRLEAATLCDPLPPRVARLGSWVAYHDDRAGRKRQGRLVAPAEADVYARRISVCSPIGSGLIGLTEGQAIDWPDPVGGTRRLTLLWVEEAAEAAPSLPPRP